MIVRVLDTDGTVVHDCAQLGCTTSWDGYVIATGEPAPGRSGAGVPDGFTVDGDTARRD
jgi:hypothetical protein